MASGLARFCVPAFVLASGLILFQSRSARPMSMRTFLALRSKRVLVPWLFWTPVFLLLDWRYGQVGSLGPWLAFGPGHLYFLVLIAQLYVVFLFVPRDLRPLRWFALGAVVLQLALMTWRTYARLPSGVWVEHLFES